MKWHDLRIQVDLKLIENFNYVRVCGGDSMGFPSYTELTTEAMAVKMMKISF